MTYFDAVVSEVRPRRSTPIDPLRAPNDERSLRDEALRRSPETATDIAREADPSFGADR
jgi:hypothetical protein